MTKDSWRAWCIKKRRGKKGENPSGLYAFHSENPAYAFDKSLPSLLYLISMSAWMECRGSHSLLFFLLPFFFFPFSPSPVPSLHVQFNTISISKHEYNMYSLSVFLIVSLLSSHLLCHWNLHWFNRQSSFLSCLELLLPRHEWHRWMNPSF